MTQTTIPPDDDKALIVAALNLAPLRRDEREKIFDALNRLTIGAWRYVELKGANR